MLLGSHCLGLPGCAQLNKRPCPCFLQLTLQIHEAPCWPHAAWSSFSAHLARCLSHDTGADTHTHKCAHGHINTTRDQRRHILTRTQSRTHSVLLRSYIHPHRHSWTRKPWIIFSICSTSTLIKFTWEFKIKEQKTTMWGEGAYW